MHQTGKQQKKEHLVFSVVFIFVLLPGAKPLLLQAVVGVEV